MIKIESIIRPEKLEEVKKSLGLLGVNGMTVFDVEGVGKQPAKSRLYRGQEFTIDLLPKVKIEVVVPEEKKEAVIDELLKSARTGEVGDGKIFVTNVSEVYRIRTSEQGIKALS